VLGAAVVSTAAWWTWTAAADAGWFDARSVPVTDDVARAMLRDVKRWDAATSGERRGVAERVAKRLDAEKAGFTLLRVRPFGFDGHRHEIAVFRHETTGLEFSLIPGGTFAMGSHESEADRNPDETQHEVTLTRAYLLARTECTQAAYERVTGKNPCSFPAPDRPVVFVSWDTATDFCAKADLRLPTEAEWEYACRAGTATRYWSGDAESDLARIGWYAENLDPVPKWLRWVLDKMGGKPLSPETKAVGLLPPNPFGLHDVHGNVWELCADWFGEYSQGPATDPVGADGGRGRVVRGGSWRWFASEVRAPLRLRRYSDYRRDDLGFRPARSVPEE
jgi:formylglycine-generating enzyme required for sulfatase activity